MPAITSRMDGGSLSRCAATATTTSTTSNSRMSWMVSVMSRPRTAPDLFLNHARRNVTIMAIKAVLKRTTGRRGPRPFGEWISASRPRPRPGTSCRPRTRNRRNPSSPARRLLGKPQAAQRAAAIEVMGVMQGEDRVDEHPGQHDGADGERSVTGKVWIGPLDQRQFGEDRADAGRRRDGRQNQDGVRAVVLRGGIASSSGRPKGIATSSALPPR